MKIAYLGAGTWGFALASLLVENGHEVVMWTRDPAFKELLEETREHPKLKGFIMPPSVRFTSNLHEAIAGAECIVESVTSSGVRAVFKDILPLEVPLIITSKGIEQGSGFLLPEVIADLAGQPRYPWVGVLSGPSHAEEVIQKLPTSLVCSAYDPAISRLIHDLFSRPMFRIYPNTDLHGVCFGGAMKNIIAIACGISDGLSGSDNAKAALMTRGLHEMRKLCVVKDCKPETLNGLSGMGDLCVTCLSEHSRNYRFGRLIAEGFSSDAARQKIGMAVEGIYTCISVLELGKKHRVPVPVTEAVCAILFEGLDPKEAVRSLLTRAIKEEHL